MENIVYQTLNKMVPQRGSEGLAPQFGKFCLEKKIGAGVFGTVYTARPKSDLTRLVAIKIEPAGINMSRLKYEATILEYMHAVSVKKGTPFVTETYVPVVFWYGRGVATANQNTNLGLAMTYFGEITAEQCIKQERRSGKPTEGQRPDPHISPSGLLYTAISILRFLFERRIVHRDIKPAHFIYSPGGWRLVDFGLATYIEEGQCPKIPLLSITEPTISSGSVQTGKVNEFITGNIRYASIRAHKGHTSAMCDDAVSVGYVVYEWLSNTILPWSLENEPVDALHIMQKKESTDFGTLNHYFSVCSFPGYVSNTRFGLDALIE
jgi:serine/threonine protein kinase